MAGVEEDELLLVVARLQEAQRRLQTVEMDQIAAFLTLVQFVASWTDMHTMALNIYGLDLQLYSIHF